MVPRTYKRNENTVKAINVHLEEISIKELVEKLQDAHLEFVRLAIENYDLTDEENELLNQSLRERVKVATKSA